MTREGLREETNFCILGVLSKGSLTPVLTLRSIKTFPKGRGDFRFLWKDGHMSMLKANTRVKDSSIIIIVKPDRVVNLAKLHADGARLICL